MDPMVIIGMFCYVCWAGQHVEANDEGLLQFIGYLAGPPVLMYILHLLFN